MKQKCYLLFLDRKLYKKLMHHQVVRLKPYDHAHNGENVFVNIIAGSNSSVSVHADYGHNFYPIRS